MPEAAATDDFFFDLNGYLVLKGALDKDSVKRLNDEFDQFPRDLPTGESWIPRES